MGQKAIRILRADEIECRVGTISEKGLSLLLYKDARADMKILDEVFGSTGWQRRHEMIGGNLYCTVSIWDGEKKQWIEKMDVGTESYTEKEKGRASDSFKRACVSVGIGRELYKYAEDIKKEYTDACLRYEDVIETLYRLYMKREYLRYSRWTDIEEILSGRCIVECLKESAKREEQRMTMAANCEGETRE